MLVMMGMLLVAAPPACTTVSRQGEGFSVVEKVCRTPDSALTLTTRTYQTAATAAVPLSAERACAAPKETYALQFETLANAAGKVVAFQGQPACALDASGTHATSNGPWRVRELIVPQANGRLVLSAAGVPQAFEKHATVVEAFFSTPPAPSSPPR